MGMLNEKCIAILEMYGKDLERDIADDQDPGVAPSLKHALTMVPKAIAFFMEGRREKGFRWLGFIQGVLWSEGYYSIEELKNHNRPDVDAEKHEEEEE